MASADRTVVEAFIEFAAADLKQDYVLVSLLPWSAPAKPTPNVLAPDADGGALDADRVAEVLAEPRIVLVPCTFAAAEEEQAAIRILPQVVQSNGGCTFMVQLFPEGVVPSRESNDLILSRHNRMVAMGADDVIVNPGPGSLRKLVATCHATWKVNTARIEAVLEQEPEAATDEEVARLEKEHNTLLWEKVPQALMSHFRPMNKSAVETAFGVHNYSFAYPFATNEGIVIQAVDEGQNPCVVKIIEKKRIKTPYELECLYREYRFLSEILNHPNIVRCLGMMHSTTRVYFVLEYAGESNLKQELNVQPGQRFDEDVTMDCARQIFQAVAYCQSLQVAHRSLSLEHVVVSRARGAETYHAVLVDFYCAMVVQRDVESHKAFGRLPCIAPEVARGEAYLPLPADCWSTGAIVLEMGGGISSMQRSVPFGEDDTAAEAAGPIQQFFGMPGSHAASLSYMGGVRDERILSVLQCLLQPAPSRRSTMSSVLQMLPGAANAGAP